LISYGKAFTALTIACFGGHGDLWCDHIDVVR
jgi:hypothetical protein